MDLKKRELIVNGDIKKALITLALPIMLGNLIQTVYNLTDTYFVSRMGDIEVAAVGFVWNIVFLILSLGMGFSVAGRSLIAQYLGANDIENAKKAAGQMLSFSLIAGVSLGLLGFVLTPWIVGAMGAEGQLFENSVVYLRNIMIGMPFAFIYFAFSSILQGQGDMVTPMILSAVSVVINVILDPIFIFTLKLGVRGAALATTSARFVLAAAAVYFVIKGIKGIVVEPRHYKFTKAIVSRIVKIGLPASFGQATAAFGFTIMNVFIKSFGEMTLTAFVIGNRINSLALMPIMGIGQALNTVVGQNIGAGKIDRAKKALATSIKFALLISAIGGGLLFIVNDSVVSIFTNNPIVLEQGTYYMKIIIITLPLMGIFQSFIGLFQGSGHTKFAMMMMIGRLWFLRLPMIYLLMRFTQMDEKLIWYAMLVSNLIICTVGFIGYLKGSWKQKTI
ncbi:MAG: MATE family efflux transporter [Clostridia bacterium]|nr:MATE family efflux transporter [Clostridia bacterium]